MRVAHSAMLNVAGLGLPLLAAVVCIPVLIESLGAARFGVLTLIWAVSSYFGVFDLGLGRVLTQQIAVAIELRLQHQVGRLVGTSMGLMLVLGLAAAAILWFSAEPLASMIRGQPDHDETARAIEAMAMALPAITVTSGLRGVLEGRHAFVAVNAIRLPLGLYTFAGPVAVVMFAQPRLDWIAWALVVGRWIGAAAHVAAVAACTPDGSGRLAFGRELVRPLAVSGGWMTVSNVISPLMGYLDRFFVGAMISAAAVAWYATPHELVSKLWIVPGALTAVLFPAFAAQLALDRAGDPTLFRRAVDTLFAALLPVTAALALFAHEGLGYWIDPGFAARSAPLLQVFALGTLLNCLAHVPFTLIQSAGAARLTALAHAAELPLFVGLLWVLTSHYGIAGAALAWLARITLDTALMFELCRRLLGWPLAAMAGRRRLLQATVAAMAFAGVAIASPVLRGAWLAGTCATALVLLWQALRRPAV